MNTNKPSSTSKPRLTVKQYATLTAIEISLGFTAILHYWTANNTKLQGQGAAILQSFCILTTVALSSSVIHQVGAITRRYDIKPSLTNDPCSEGAQFGMGALLLLGSAVTAGTSVATLMINAPDILNSQSFAGTALAISTATTCIAYLALALTHRNLTEKKDANPRSENKALGIRMFFFGAINTFIAGVAGWLHHRRAVPNYTADGAVSVVPFALALLVSPYTRAITNNARDAFSTVITSSFTAYKSDRPFNVNTLKNSGTLLFIASISSSVVTGYLFGAAVEGATDAAKIGWGITAVLSAVGTAASYVYLHKSMASNLETPGAGQRLMGSTPNYGPGAPGPAEKASEAQQQKLEAGQAGLHKL
jgi:hypothetical protein